MRNDEWGMLNEPQRHDDTEEHNAVTRCDVKWRCGSKRKTQVGMSSGMNVLRLPDAPNQKLQTTNFK